MEIEAKMRVGDVAEIRRRLRAAGAISRGSHREINAFFDTSKGRLRQADKGLRLRANQNTKTGRTEYIITFKGPRQPGPLKSRPEFEFSVTDPSAAARVFAELGFAQTLSFEKLRTSWSLMGCKIELDQLPYLGMFLEIEGPSQTKIMNARRKLGLAKEPLIQEGYIAMLSKYLRKQGISLRHIRLTRQIGAPKKSTNRPRH